MTICYVHNCWYNKNKSEERLRILYCVTDIRRFDMSKNDDFIGNEVDFIESDSC